MTEETKEQTIGLGVESFISRIVKKYHADKEERKDSFLLSVDDQPVISVLKRKGSLIFKLMKFQAIDCSLTDKDVENMKYYGRGGLFFVGDPVSDKEAALRVFDCHLNDLRQRKARKERFAK